MDCTDPNCELMTHLTKWWEKRSSEIRQTDYITICWQSLVCRHGRILYNKCDSACQKTFSGCYKLWDEKKFYGQSEIFNEKEAYRSSSVRTRGLLHAKEAIYRADLSAHMLFCLDDGCGEFNIIRCNLSAQHAILLGGVACAGKKEPDKKVWQTKF